ncbi:trafficking protein particle complex subunit 10 [Cristinia sonorae]|uniref:Trafficking protein particle complex subunit 10 n=1 Tax=Cristinia sonorae TaxID=1940300 RepID=A0A8K0UZ64_9AGAR|nr:trafficking protein particle complex subunit 10 [Cristinia sonorae]
MNNGNSNAPQRATITYTAPHTFLATEHWKQVYAALLSQLPLRNLHWKSASRPNIRTIQELDVNLVPAEGRRDEHTSQIPQTVLEKPLLNAYIVVCDDAETYKNTVKKQIKDWHTSATQRKNQEWLIIHVVRPDSKAAAQRMFQMKTSVLDKIRADFNMEKKDRCVQLVWSYDSQDNLTVWAELINKLKEGILSAFDTAITQREDEVKRSEGQRQMPGWNFCTFFILKESLATSFEGMNLHDDALETYNELEALFFEVLKEKNLSWFGTLITPAPKDDSVPLLSTSKKPYRDLILANTISIFDFRIYLLARQCAILHNMHHLIEVAQKSVAFLGAFGRRLREVEDSLPKFFVESWTYASALSVVEQCDAWAKGLEFPKVALASFNALKGELVELARHQLDTIGIRVGHLPNRPPFSIGLPSQVSQTLGKSVSNRTSLQISQGEVVKALSDKDAFFTLYVKITNRAIELYAAAGRRKFALKMHGSLAALDVHRDRLTNALQTFSSLPAHYAPHGWTSLEAYMLCQALDIHSSVGKARDRDWVYILLDFLKAYIQDLGKELLMVESDHMNYVTDLVEALRVAAQSAPSEMTHHDHPAISVTISDGNARTAEGRDGAVLDVILNNMLPCPLPMDEVSVSLSGRDGSKIHFVENVKSLSPGKNKMPLFCHSAAAGTYSLHSAQIKMSNLTLQWVHSPPPTGKASRAKRPPVLVRIPKDLHAVDIRLRQSQRIQLGKTPSIVAVFTPGRNHIRTATVKLTAPSGIQFKFGEASLLSASNGELVTSDDSITLSGVELNTSVSISIPHSDASAFHAMRVNIIVEYTTTAEPDVHRTLQLVRFVLTALPVAINVEDFFRGTRLFTRFTLSSTSPQHVRILTTDLISQGKGNDGLKIVRSRSQTRRLTTITPAQPGRFLFQMDSVRGQERDPLHLRITYRMLREEVEQVIESVIDTVLEASESSRTKRPEILEILVQALEKDASWVSLYELTGELVIPNVSTEDEGIGEALDEIKKMLNQPRQLEEFSSEWREIVIPVDVPQMHILASASLQIASNPFSRDPARSLDLFAGQPIHAILTIRTSFHWAPTEDSHTSSYQMRFDIEEMSKDWLVSGRKRGDFTALDNNTFTTSVTLIALHHGELPLPKVAVTALPIPGEGRMKAPLLPSCETYQVHGAQTVLVLPRGGRSTFVVNMGESP